MNECSHFHLSPPPLSLSHPPTHTPRFCPSLARDHLHQEAAKGPHIRAALARAPREHFGSVVHAELQPLRRVIPEQQWEGRRPCGALRGPCSDGVPLPCQQLAQTPFSPLSLSPPSLPRAYACPCSGTAPLPPPPWSSLELRGAGYRRRAFDLLLKALLQPRLRCAHLEGTLEVHQLHGSSPLLEEPRGLPPKDPLAVLERLAEAASITWLGLRLR
jgi:hypothetical protein